MPQMAPLPWLFLSLMFMMTLLALAMNLFHLNTFTKSYDSLETSPKEINWKW